MGHRKPGSILVFFEERRLIQIETCQVGKLVQNCQNISNPSPELLRGVEGDQTQITTAISNLSQRQL